ncbi:MAG: double-strand break repair helicase AddA, partial [Pseudomonadota bacterium]
GKTYVLAQRVVRLLLAGVEPSRILCLTFTKAAAGEMANRVFKDLAEWVVMPDAELRSKLEALEGKPASPELVRKARRLFASALETPGGLKVQTIHAFCEALLHRFPLEANVPGAFAVITDTQKDALITGARDGVFAEIGRDTNGSLARAYAAIIESGVSDHNIDRLFEGLVSRREALETWFAKHGGADAAVTALFAKHQVPLDATETGIAADVVAMSTIPEARWERLAEIAASGSSTMVTLADAIGVAMSNAPADERLAALKSCVLTSGGVPRKFGKYPTNAVEDALPGIRQELEAEADDLVRRLGRLLLHRALHRTCHAMHLGAAFLARYRKAKRETGGLDYDDLIARTADLLTRQDARQWVLYKLDAGLDHILVDEAQDTSPNQWKVITALADEFFAGEGAAGRSRSVFAVGDEKQSIYSFQGARPDLFGKTRRDFQRKADAAGKAFDPVILNQSMRSTEDVLAAVDAVFAQEVAYRGLTSDNNEPPPHGAARAKQAGEVDIWSVATADKGETPDDWTVPVTQSDTRHQADTLAERVVAQLADWFKNDERLTADGSLITPGDILILVRSRDRFVSALTRGLKEAGIPVAGSDRLTLTDDIAIMDLIALGRTMVNTGDDLSLAALLKSPLLGLTDADVERLALARLQPPRSSLFDALRAEAADEPSEEVKRACTLLERWLARADTVPVYEFYAQVLGADGGRQKFYARVTREVEDVLDAFIDQTLACEQESEPGLQAFLERLEAQPPTIKREMDDRSDAVRIMTVHAAKGLEAPVVFLIDKHAPPHKANKVDPLYSSHDGFLWIPAKEDHGSETIGALEALARRDADEHRRLLYVGMTRAEDRLVVAGYRGANEVKESWHSMVAAALLPGAQQIHEDVGDGFTIHRWRRPGYVAGEAATGEPPLDDRPHVEALPGWARHRLPSPPPLPRPLSPSGAHALIDDMPVYKGASIAAEPEGALSLRRRGTMVHLLLQWLVDRDPATRAPMADAYISRAAPELDAATRTSLVEQIVATLADPALAPFLDPATSAAEVPVTGNVALGTTTQPVFGSIDRLAITKDGVWMLDYKTGAHVPESAADVTGVYVTQMALYRALLSLIYPDRAIRAALIYTAAPEGPRFLEIGAPAMDDAITKLGAALSAA